MGPALFPLLQATAPGAPERIDLTVPATTGGCTHRYGGNVLVCGRRAGCHRLAPLALVPGAATGLLGGAAVVAVETEAATMSNGAQDKRLMARIRLPL